VPTKLRVSIGWPKRSASCGAIGECWSDAASSDQHYELFISPELTDGNRIIDVLCHELTHATVGMDAGHGKRFKQCALKVGLVGPMRATTAGPDLNEWSIKLIRMIGAYPAGFITDRPKQGTRLARCECEACGYLARVTRKWLDLAGPPVCPVDKVAMTFKTGTKETA
jgi:SprT-like family